MKTTSIEIKIDLGKGDLSLSEDSAVEVQKKVDEFLQELVDIHSYKEGGFVGSGFNFLTNTRDYHLSLGFGEQ